MGTIALVVFKGRLHIGYLAAIIAASNAGGAPSVIGDTTTTLMWIDGVAAKDVVHAIPASLGAFLIFGFIGAWQQHHYQAIQSDANPGLRLDYGKLVIVALILALAIMTNWALDFPGMEIFHRILKTAVEGGASDVHLKIGTPVVFRINRQLIAIECPFPDRGVDEQRGEAHHAEPFAQAAGAGARNGLFLFRARHRPVPHEPVSAARPVVPGDALCEDPRAELRGTGLAGADQARSPNRRAASCWWPVRPAAANPRRWRR